MSSAPGVAPSGTAAAERLRSAPRLPRWAGTLLVTVTLLVVWELASRLGLARLGVLAAPTEIVADLVTRAPLYATNFAATAWVAVRGWFWGDLAAIVLAVLFVQVRALEKLFLRLALTLFCLPLVAVMPLLQLSFDPDTARVTLAALSVFFTTLIGTMLGLRSAEGGPLTMVRAWGGGSFSGLRFVRAPSSIPSLISGLQIGAAAAVLGAIFGEFIGASRGLGVLLINGLQQLHQDQVYGVAVLATLMAAVPYLLLGMLRTRLAPWSAGLSTTAPREGRSGRTAARLAAGFGWTVASLAVIVAAWWLYLIVFRISPFVGKTPVVVFQYLFTVPAAHDNRAALGAALGVTLLHAGVGYAVGLLIGVVVAVLFVLFPAVEFVLTPAAVALRSVPIIALIPILILAFGRGLPGVVAITTIVTFFPTLATTQLALSRVPRDALILMRSYDSSVLSTLWRLRLPAALPAIFASARIAAPSAVLGATLAEWLATGDGLGHLIVVSRSYSDYNQLWAGAVLLAAVSLIFYSLVSAAERAVLTRFAPEGL